MSGDERAVGTLDGLKHALAAQALKTVSDEAVKVKSEPKKPAAEDFVDEGPLTAEEVSERVRTMAWRQEITRAMGYCRDGTQLTFYEKDTMRDPYIAAKMLKQIYRIFWWSLDKKRFMVRRYGAFGLAVIYEKGAAPHEETPVFSDGMIYTPQEKAGLLDNLEKVEEFRLAVERGNLRIIAPLTDFIRNRDDEYIWRAGIAILAKAAERGDEPALAAGRRLAEERGYDFDELMIIEKYGRDFSRIPEAKEKIMALAERTENRNTKKELAEIWKEADAVKFKYSAPMMRRGTMMLDEDMREAVRLVYGISHDDPKAIFDARSLLRRDGVSDEIKKMVLYEIAMWPSGNKDSPARKAALEVCGEFGYDYKVQKAILDLARIRGDAVESLKVAGKLVAYESNQAIGPFLRDLAREKLLALAEIEDETAIAFLKTRILSSIVYDDVSACLRVLIGLKARKSKAASRALDEIREAWTPKPQTPAPAPTDSLGAAAYDELSKRPPAPAGAEPPSGIGLEPVWVNKKTGSMAYGEKPVSGEWVRYTNVLQITHPDLARPAELPVTPADTARFAKGLVDSLQMLIDSKVIDRASIAAAGMNEELYARGKKELTLTAKEAAGFLERLGDPRQIQLLFFRGGKRLIVTTTGHAVKLLADWVVGQVERAVSDAMRGDEDIGRVEPQAVSGALDHIWEEYLYGTILDRVKNIPGIESRTAFKEAEYIFNFYSAIKTILKIRGFSRKNLNSIMRAFLLGLHLHSGQPISEDDKRPYYRHCVEAAFELLQSYGIDGLPDQDTAADTLAATFLHEAVEHPSPIVIATWKMPDGYAGDREVSVRERVWEMIKIAASPNAVAILASLEESRERAGFGKVPAHQAETNRAYMLKAAPLGSRLVWLADRHVRFGGLKDSRDGMAVKDYFDTQLAATGALLQSDLPRDIKIAFLENLITASHANNRLAAERAHKEEPVPAARLDRLYDALLDLCGSVSAGGELMLQARKRALEDNRHLTQDEREMLSGLIRRNRERLGRGISTTFTSTLMEAWLLSHLLECLSKPKLPLTLALYDLLKATQAQIDGAAPIDLGGITEKRFLNADEEFTLALFISRRVIDERVPDIVLTEDEALAKFRNGWRLERLEKETVIITDRPVGAARTPAESAAVAPEEAVGARLPAQTAAEARALLECAIEEVFGPKARAVNAAIYEELKDLGEGVFSEISLNFTLSSREGHEFTQQEIADVLVRCEGQVKGVFERVMSGYDKDKDEAGKAAARGSLGLLLVEADAALKAYQKTPVKEAFHEAARRLLNILANIRERVMAIAEGRGKSPVEKVAMDLALELSTKDLKVPETAEGEARKKLGAMGQTVSRVGRARINAMAAASVDIAIELKETVAKLQQKASLPQAAHLTEGEIATLKEQVLAFRQANATPSPTQVLDALKQYVGLVRSEERRRPFETALAAIESQLSPKPGEEVPAVIRVYDSTTQLSIDETFVLCLAFATQFKMDFGDHTYLLTPEAARLAIARGINPSYIEAGTAVFTAPIAGIQRRDASGSPAAEAEIEAIAGAFNKAWDSKEFPTLEKERRTLLLPYEFYANGEFEKHANAFRDRFNLVRISGRSHKEFVERALNMAVEFGLGRTVVYLPSDIPAAELNALLEAKTPAGEGIRFIRADQGILRSPDYKDDKYRTKFQLHTYAAMLLVRNVDLDRSSSVYRTLAFYLKSHFTGLKGDAEIAAYIEAIVKGDINGLIKAILTYRPVEQFDTPKYDAVIAPLIAA